MVRKLLWLAAVVPLIGLLGCASSQLPMQPQVTRFNPIVAGPQTSLTVKFGETYISYEANDYQINAAVFAYQSIIMLSLQITNKTGVDISPEEYSLSLHDGRDLKLVQMLSRADLITVKDKLEGKKSSGGLESQVIQGALDTVTSITSIISKNDVSRGLDLAAGNYFSFRPIYKHETRNGILCFVLDYRPEYPFSLLIKIKNEKVKLKFMPRPGK